MGEFPVLHDPQWIYTNILPLYPHHWLRAREMWGNSKVILYLEWDDAASPKVSGAWWTWIKTKFCHILEMSNSANWLEPEQLSTDLLITPVALGQVPASQFYSIESSCSRLSSAPVFTLAKLGCQACLLVHPGQNMESNASITTFEWVPR